MTLVEPSDQIVEGMVAEALQRQYRTGLSGWVVMKDDDRFIARLVTDRMTNLVIVGETLNELRTKLPAGLTHSSRSPSDQPEVVEVWFLP